MSKINEIIEERLFGLEHIIHSIHHNNELLEYMAYNLHNQRFNLFNNLGLHYIWGSLMGIVILDFYKVTNKSEKHSFQKIINLSIEQKCSIDIETIQEKINTLTEFYDKTDFETVRSKYLAHQDIGVPQIKTELTLLYDFKKIVFELFELITREFKRENVYFHSNVKNSLAEIFDVIDEYDKILGFLLAKAIDQEKTVEIAQIQEIIKRRDKNAS